MSSPTKRGSLDNVFPGVHVPHATQPNSSPTSKSMHQILRSSINRAGFPAWRTLSRADKDQQASLPVQARFTLTINPEVRSYKAGQVPPAIEFDQAASHIMEIREHLSSADDATVAQYTELIQEEMSALIFSSNANEKAGLDHEETRRICRRVFAGEDVSAADIEPRSAQYEANLLYLKKINQVANPSVEHIIRSRREIVQHAQALKHIVDAFLIRDAPLTEDLILQTHKILCGGIGLDKDHGSKAGNTTYAGVYRQHEVFAGNVGFTAYNEVPWRMRKLVQDFNDDVYGREESGKLDPFYLAADICQDFVTIHPFADGNGRMCRLLLNAYLIKYAGVIMNIGEHDAEREEYMAIAKEATSGGCEEEEIARAKLGRFVMEKAMSPLRKLRVLFRN